MRLDYLRCLRRSQFLPIRNGCCARIVRQESLLRVWLCMFSQGLEPRGCKFSECWGLTSGPEVPGKNPSDDPISKSSASQILQKGDHGAVCLVVLPVKQSVRGCELFWKRVKTNDCSPKARLLQNHACLQEMSHSVQHHTFAIIVLCSSPAPIFGWHSRR